MSDYLVIIDEKNARMLDQEIKDILAPGGTITASCHVAVGAYAVRTTRDSSQIFRNIVSIVGPSAIVLVAPLSGEWLSQNCTSAFSCFRGPDDD